MSISDIEKEKKRLLKTALIYLLLSLFVALFGAVYEVFGHGIYSYYMIYAFAYPLVGGTLLFLLLALMPLKRYPHGLTCQLYHGGLATLTLGSILQGVLAIYGTTNRLMAYYPVVGLLLLGGGIALYGISKNR